MSAGIGYPDVLTALEDVTLTAPVRGALLTKGVGDWIDLDPGAAGRVLTSNGAGADLSWEVPAGGGGGVTDHGLLTGLADDDHPQYPLLAGRVGGQSLRGGTLTTETLTLSPNATDAAFLRAAPGNLEYYASAGPAGTVTTPSGNVILNAETSCGLAISSYSGGASLRLYAANTSRTSPTAISANGTIAQIVPRPRGATLWPNFTGVNPGIAFQAAEAVTDTAAGMNIRFITVAIGGIVGVLHCSMNENGSTLYPRSAPPVTSSGTVSIGGGPWDGVTAGFFSGVAGGTLSALNSTSGFTGNLADWQVAGSRKFSLSYQGNLTIPAAPQAVTTRGLVSLGSGPFDGSTLGFFVGSSSGTVLAVNAASGYAGRLTDYQVAGVRRMALDAAGQLLLPTTGSTGGINIGGDALTQIYRSATNTLRIPANLVLDNALTVTGQILAGPTTGIGGTTALGVGGPVIIQDGSGNNYAFMGKAGVWQGDGDTNFAIAAYASKELRFYTSAGATPRVKVGTTGRLFATVPNSAPTDSDIMTSGVTFYLNEAGNTLVFRVRYSDGTTVKAGTVALT